MSNTNGYVLTDKYGWENLKGTYKGDFSKVKFFKVLTGYIEDSTIEKIQNLAKNKNRKIDIGYRAIYEPKRYYHGNYYHLKGKIGEVFEKYCKENAISCDISLKEKDFLYGTKWYKFLLNCKYILGIESGVTLIDRNGEIRKKTTEYINGNPQAQFDEVARNCFPREDGRISYFALAPRHLEACMTKTCQVLTEGEYNGILKPGIHYIELKKDFSNIKEEMV